MSAAAFQNSGEIEDPEMKCYTPPTMQGGKPMRLGGGGGSLCGIPGRGVLF